MPRILRIVIPVMFIGLVLAISYAVMTATSKGDDRSDIEKLATGSLAALETSKAGSALPEGSFTDLAGNELSLEAFSGKYILVNFWATWCGPCEREMPSLGELEATKGSDRFQVVAISVDAVEDRDYAIQRLEELAGKGVLDFYFAPPESWDIVYNANARGFPTSVIYSPDGTEIARIAGEADWSSYEAAALIDNLLGSDD